MDNLDQINNALTALAAEFGIDTTTTEAADKLDDLTHAFAQSFEIN